MTAGSLTLAHLSDVHMSPLDGFSTRHWNVKRGLGYLNWHRGRKAVHSIEVLARLVADMQARAPDHIAVTGDLVNLGLPSEYLVALRWLETLGTPETVTVVPGNHDIYVRSRSEPGVRRWSAYMQPDNFGRTLGPTDASGFPFVRRVGPAALIGVNSAVPTPPFVAAGKVGGGQRERLGELLDQVAAAGLIRVVLIHHPPLPGQAPPRRALADATKVCRVLAAHGAELVLHGHNHSDTLAPLTTATGTMAVVGIASGSAAQRNGRAPLARYNLFRLRGAGAPIEFEARGLLEPGGPIVQLESRVLRGGTASEPLRPAGSLPADRHES